MKKLILLLLLIPCLCVADVDTKDGVAITTTSNIDGSSGMGKCDGQTVAGGSFTCDDYTFYSDLDAEADITNPTCGTGGTATNCTWPGVGTQKGAETTDGFVIPESNLSTSAFTIMFNFIPSHDNDNALMNSINLIITSGYGTYTSFRFIGENGGGSNYRYIIDLYDNAITKHTINTDFLSALQFTASDIIPMKLTMDKALGDLRLYVDTDNNGSYDQSFQQDDAVFTMHDDWARSTGTTLVFFKSGTHTSKIDNLIILDSVQ